MPGGRSGAPAPREALEARQPLATGMRVAVFVWLMLSPSSAAFTFHVAPLQCYTNRHFRKLLRLLSDTAVLWTEMEKASDLVCLDDRGRMRRLQHSAEADGPLVLQLGGSDVATLTRAARLAKSHGFAEVNLNCGCPSVETGGASYGAALMRDAALTHGLTCAIADELGAPVSIKCRLGTHAASLADGGLPEERYETLAAFADTVTAGGAVDHLIVHARSAVLGGFSPAKNRCVPPLRPEYVHRLAAEMPHVRVTLNGGLDVASSERCMREVDELQRHRDQHQQPEPQQPHGCQQAHTSPSHTRGVIDGVMCGRGILRRPLSLCRVDAAGFARGGSGSGGSGGGDGGGGGSGGGSWKANPRRGCGSVRAVRLYEEYALRTLADGEEDVPAVVTPLLLLLEELREAAAHESADPEIEAALTAAAAEQEAMRVQVFLAVWEATAAILDASGRGRRKGGRTSDAPQAAPLAEMPFRQLSKMLSQATGKQVANKIVRNRREDVASAALLTTQ